MYFVSVDGCKGQCWLAVILGRDSRAEARVFSDIFALWRECKAVSPILEHTGRKLCLRSRFK
jgi:hypothetical protein